MLQSDPSRIMNWDAFVYNKQQEWIEMKWVITGKYIKLSELLWNAEMVSLNSELNLWQVSDIDLLLVYGHWPWLSWDAIWRTVLDIRLNPEVFSLTWVYLNKPTQFVQPCPKQRIRQLSLFCNAYYLFRFRIRVKLAWEDFSQGKSIISRQVHVFFLVHDQL